MKLLGIHRNQKFSPNHIGNDDAIFSLTAQALEKRGNQIRICSEDDFLEQTTVAEQRIFTMARQKAVVQKLQAVETAGAVVVNSGFGIQNCFRINMHRALEENGVPVPRSIIMSTAENDPLNEWTDQGFWIKRGDFHAIHREDVTFVRSRKEGREMLREYARRDIAEVLISEHLAGDLVKFYGVRGTDFFYWFYPYEHNHHKYVEYEAINGKAHHHAFDEADLQKVATASAAAVGVSIYGGDAIVGKDGSFHIIDLNDWPSFAPCREEAADAIADVLHQTFTQAEL
ncbi:hypothetical protein ACFPMF_26405 [Larkinella bovis]|uniref:ATP-grasp domain-containing protein n=1 Tax=Larkinella bovis TaxID=683041 RepID=A0ABW0IHY8_9BACT